MLVCHARNASQHLASNHTGAPRSEGWWDNLLGPGKCIAVATAAEAVRQPCGRTGPRDHTIVTMAVLDRWSQRRQRAGAKAWPEAARLSLVFDCALIHGLGLAGALGGLGLDTPHRLWSLAGFNLGIELAQVLVAALAGAMLLGLRRFLGPAGPRLVHHLASLVAVAVGSLWFVQRVAAGA